METIRVVQLVLLKTELRQLTALKTILIVLTKEVYLFQSGQLVENASEELHLVVLECISTANRRASSEVVELFYQNESSAQISQILYAILLILDKSGARKIKTTALDCLMSLLHVHESSDLDDIVLRNQIGGIVFFALPMLWTSLCKIILSDAKIGHRVIERGLFTLGRIVCLIMEDDREVDMTDNELQVKDFKALILSSTKTTEEQSSVLDQKEKKRTPEWLRAAGKKLMESFKSLISLTGHESPAIRKAVGLCCEQWTGRCRKSLEDNLGTFLEILLILSEDQDQEIRQHFSEYLNKLKLEANSSFAIINRQLIETHSLRMSRIIQRQSKKEHVMALALLKAQLKELTEEEMTLLFSNEKFLDVFVMNFLTFIQFNAANVDLLKEEHTIRDYVDRNGSESLLKPWEDFKYFNGKSSQILGLLQDVMASVKGRTPKRILMQYLMDNLRAKTKYSAEVLKAIQIIVNATISGEEGMDDLEISYLESILDELLDDKYWNLSYQVVRNEDRSARGQEHLQVSEHTEGLYESSLVVKYVDLNQAKDQLDYLISPVEAKINVLFSCVLMETVAVFGWRLGGERFQKYVFKIIFNLLSSAGNTNFCIHSAGLLALTEITQLYNCTGGIRELIMMNSDYVMFFVNQSLKDSSKSTSALDVISVVLEFCSKDVLEYVELIVNRLLEECTKYHRMKDLSAYLRIFGLFLKSLNPVEMENVIEKNLEESVDNTLQSWLKVLNPVVEEDFEDQIDDQEDVPEDHAEVKKETPKEILISRQIMEVALKHISSRNHLEVLAAMETLTWGVATLRQNEDELLPVVHHIWTTLSQRFNDDNPVVLRNSFKMLITLADSAKEFIHRRTVDEVVPTLNKILRNSWSIVGSQREESGRYTQQFKLVQEIISNYHLIIIRLNIQQKHLDDILSAVMIYLKPSSPPLLKTKAKEFFDHLRLYDGATVYQKLIASGHQNHH